MIRFVSLTMVTVLFLGACGGGSSDSTEPPPSPEPSESNESDQISEDSQQPEFSEANFISDNCAHSPVVVIDQSDGATVTPPTGQVRELVSTAIDSFPILLCDAVSIIIVQPLPIHIRGVVESSTGNIVRVNSKYATDAYLNGEVEFDGNPDVFDFIATEQPADLLGPSHRAELVRTVVHEAAHSATNLLNVTIQPDPILDDWQNDGEKATAKTVIGSTRMVEQLPSYWNKLHLKFANLNRANTYTSAWRERYDGVDTSTFLEDGFFRPYGAENSIEDIATIVGSSTISYIGQSDSSLDASAVTKSVCETLQNYSLVNEGDWTDVSIPLGISAAYTKLALVRDLGLISESVFDSCTNKRWEITEGTKNGFTTFIGGVPGANWHESPTRSYGIVSTQSIYLIIRAEGDIVVSGREPTPAEVELRVLAASPDTPDEKVPMPRGLYSIEVNPFTAFQLPTPPFFGMPAYFMIREKGNSLGLSTYQIFGWIHVAESSANFTRANIQMTIGYRPGAPLIGIPDTWDPPLHIQAIWRN